MEIRNQDIVQRLREGNARYLAAGTPAGDISPALRARTAEAGQNPYAIVITCADSRVIPESIFSAGLGELFVIRVAGNVLDNHQLGSIEYAAAHLDTKLILMLGHTGCGAIHAAMEGGGDGFIKFITDEVRAAIGGERDDYRACVKNVEHGVAVIREEFRHHPEIPSAHLDILGAVYRIDSGEVDWLL